MMTNPDVAKKGSKLEGAAGFLNTPTLLPDWRRKAAATHPLAQILSFLGAASALSTVFGPITAATAKPLGFSARPRNHGR
jgi:hypothetical protein